MEEYLTSSFKTALKAANKDKSARTDKHVQDKLLHKDLDKLVKEESKTNSKMARIVKSTSGKSSGSSRTKHSFSTKRYSSPSRKSGKRSGGTSGGGPVKKKRFHKRKDQDKKEGRKESAKKEDKGESKPLSFISAYARGVFSLLALSMLADAGLSVATAVSVAAFPIAGRIARCWSAWKTITKDRWVLNIIRDGYKLQFKSQLPPTPHRVANLPTDAAGAAILDFEVKQMLAKGAINVVESSEDELVACFFARPKKQPGKWRPIVSLKFLNKYLIYLKFRMTTISDVKRWIRKDYFFTSLDLQDAYFSVPLHKSAGRFVRFVWRGICYEFAVIMFGLGASPRVFTKTLKAVVKYLRIIFNILILAYLDDFLIQAPTYEECLLHTEIAVLVFQCLGFEVNFSKSSMIPSQNIEHLGFLWDSVKMEISLPTVKKQRIIDQSQSFLDNGGCTADQLRSFLGRLESVRAVTAQAPLHYRALQYLLQPLRKGSWNGRRFIPLTRAARLDLEWWVHVFPLRQHQVSPLRRREVTITIKADASGNFGWGGHSSRGEFCQGQWSAQEARSHINRKEIWAGHFSLDRLMAPGDHVQLSLDSMTAVAFINRMGGTRSLPLCLAAIELWDTVLSRGCWVTAVWLSRDENQLSDMLSKTQVAAWEFCVQQSVLDHLWARWFLPTVDVFASKDCHVLPGYYSWFPDMGALAQDAFSVVKWPQRIYVFPPVPLIPMALEKIGRDQSTAILIVPGWRSALWWDQISNMLLQEPVSLGDYRKVLWSPRGREIPYLQPLLACLVGKINTLSSQTRQLC